MAKPLYYPTRKLSTAKTVPFGYVLSKDDPQLLEPIVSEINALRKAVEYAKEGYSYKTARDWLVANTGREISVVGFWKICKSWNKNKHRYARARTKDNQPGESSTAS